MAESGCEVGPLHHDYTSSHHCASVIIIYIVPTLMCVTYKVNCRKSKGMHKVDHQHSYEVKWKAAVMAHLCKQSKGTVATTQSAP